MLGLGCIYWSLIRVEGQTVTAKTDADATTSSLHAGGGELLFLWRKVHAQCNAALQQLIMLPENVV